MSKLGKFVACSLAFGGAAVGTVVGVKKLKTKRVKETRVFKNDDEFVDYITASEPNVVEVSTE